LSVSDKIDIVITNRILALPIFFIVIGGIYYVAIQSLGSFTIDIMGMFFNEVIGQAVFNLLEKTGTAPWLVGLVVDGIIGGLGLYWYLYRRL
jgi:ferrous iron transport protein B